MRLALLIYGSLNTISGGYLYDRKLVQYLEQQGDSVEIVSLPWRSYPRHLTDNFSASILGRLQHLRADILLQDELNHPSLFWLNQRLRVAYPIISIVHHLRSSEARPSWQNSFYRSIERAYLRGVNGFIFNSQTTRRVVENLVGSSRLPSQVAYPAGDRFAPSITQADIVARARQPGPLHLLFVGNIIPRKGLHILLDALARLPSNSAHLTIVGRLDVDAAYTHQIRRQVQRLQLKTALEFTGPLDDLQLAARLNQSQELVVPSSYEGFGIVYLEAMSYGLPIIATTAGAASEIATHGENGFLIMPGDVTALADYLRFLQSNRGRLAEMSLSARRNFLARPGWDQMGQAVHHFLHTL